MESVDLKMKIKPLLVLCCPENYCDPIFVFPPENRLMEPWEIAVSRSSREKRIHRNLRGFPCYFSDERTEIIEKLPIFDLILFFPLSNNSLAKFALGIQDSLPSFIFYRASELGISILLDSTYGSDDDTMNPHLRKIYRRYWETIVGGTVGKYSETDFEQCLQKIIRHKNSPVKPNFSGNRQIITKDDVLLARDGVGAVKVASGAIVTDLAKEEALRWGVTFEPEIFDLDS